jgi:hypothetical protein
MGDGDSGIGRDRYCRGHTGHYFERNSGHRHRFGLFASAPKDKGISALEPNDDLARTGLFDQQAVDFLLILI